MSLILVDNVNKYTTLFIGATGSRSLMVVKEELQKLSKTPAAPTTNATNTPAVNVTATNVMNTLAVNVPATHVQT